ALIAGCSGNREKNNDTGAAPGAGTESGTMQGGAGTSADTTAAAPTTGGATTGGAAAGGAGAESTSTGGTGTGATSTGGTTTGGTTDTARTGPRIHHDSMAPGTEAGSDTSQGPRTKPDTSGSNQ
ncbi:MAG TPA: hypothetical protein VIM84_05495, partial [Gemmatimonadales bacterium]